MTQITPGRLFFLTTILASLLLLPGINSLVNIIIWTPFIVLFGVISIFYYRHARNKNKQLSRRLGFWHFGLTLLGSLLLWFFLHNLFSTIPHSDDPEEINFRGHLYKLLIAFLILGPLLIIGGQIFFIKAIANAKNKTADT